MEGYRTYDNGMKKLAMILSARTHDDDGDDEFVATMPYNMHIYTHTKHT